MQREELEKHKDNKMICKKCGRVHRYFEVVAKFDSSELPGDLLWMNSCKGCGCLDFEEVWPDDGE